MKRLLFAVLILFASPHLSLATHIIGGELNYRCLGGNLYEIHLRVYRDCYYGDPDFDDPAAVGVFSANNNLITTVYIPFDTKQKLDPTFNQANPCVKIPANVCVEATEYVTTVTLPAIAGGYQLTYQRCCRNQTVVNLQNPNNVGATYYAVIPPKSMATCNSNPVFKAWPPIFVCRNMDINFDHSATDADGDSIAYHLCKPFDGASFSIPKPTVPSAPPYSYIPWINPYTTNDPLGGVPLNIDPKTGWLTGSPNKVGQFVVGVCADEYRNGTLISTTKRDFQFNVLDCEPDVTAGALGLTTNCVNHTVQFWNTSTGATNYFWNFGDPTTLADTSLLVNPTYNYPNSGPFTVTLIAYSPNGDACNDTITNLVTVVDSCRPCSMTLNAVKTDASCRATAGCNPGPPVVTVCGGFPTDTLWAQEQIVVVNGACARVKSYTLYSSCLSGNSSSSVNGVCTCKCDGQTLPNSTYTKTDTTWIGGTLGTANVTPSGGQAPYSYQWSNGKTTNSISGLDAGTYCVSVVDATGLCADEICLHVAGGGNMTLNLTSTPISNCGLKDGSVTTSPSGGTAPYTYLWSPGGQTTASISNLGPGTYTVVVTDKDSCSTVDQITLVSPSVVTPNLTSSSANCANGNDGSITVTNSGGTGPYTYAWSPGGYTTQNPTGLTSGYYKVTVTDANGCQGIAGISVTEPTPITATTSMTDATCFGDASGTATVTASGGTAPYTYAWITSPVQTLNTATGLTAGTYTVIITDSKGCKDTTSVTVGEPFPVTPEATNTTQSGCVGSVLGSASVQISGGSAPFQYLWCNGQTTASVTGLTVGVCGITVTDANGCQGMTDVDIIYPPKVTASTIAQDLLCHGGGLGAITVNISGGRPGYTYTWSPGGYTTQNIIGIVPGTYYVTVTDADGCSDTTSATVSQPTALQPTISNTGTSCTGASDGTATVSVTGGTPGYLYQWDTSTGNQTTAAATGLSAGIYTVRITDSNGCDTVLATTVLDGSAPPNAKFKYTPQLQCDGVTYALTNTSTNATNYHWILEDGSTTNLSNTHVTLPYGDKDYVITLIASNGSLCSDTEVVTLNPGPLNLNITPPNVFTPNHDGTNDCFYIPLVAGLDNCGELLVFNRWGVRIYDNQFGICWDGKTDTGNDAPEGTYYWIFKMGDQIDMNGWVALVRNP